MTGGNMLVGHDDDDLNLKKKVPLHKKARIIHGEYLVFGMGYLVLGCRKIYLQGSVMPRDSKCLAICRMASSLSPNPTFLDTNKTIEPKYLEA